MDADVKICPQCNAEYYAHIVDCATCGIELVWPGADPVPSRMVEAIGEDAQLVCVEQGDLARIGVVAKELKNAGFESQVLKASMDGCSSSDGFGLFVTASLAPEAAREVEAIWYRLHPELRESDERQQAGRCPACGADIRSAKAECPDCGLNIGGLGGGAGSEGGDCGRSDCGGGCGAGH